uniref:Uncharacterized protein n=1 Tax=Cacopsylla melanoneura TaxID=428564 RepID=A0A8D8XL14_9HEMI
MYRSRQKKYLSPSIKYVVDVQKNSINVSPNSNSSVRDGMSLLPIQKELSPPLHIRSPCSLPSFPSSVEPLLRVDRALSASPVCLSPELLVSRSNFPIVSPVIPLYFRYVRCASWRRLRFWTDVPDSWRSFRLPTTVVVLQLASTSPR